MPVTVPKHGFVPLDSRTPPIDITKELAHISAVTRMGRCQLVRAACTVPCMEPKLKLLPGCDPCTKPDKQQTHMVCCRTASCSSPKMVHTTGSDLQLQLQPPCPHTHCVSHFSWQCKEHRKHQMSCGGCTHATGAVAACASAHSLVTAPRGRLQNRLMRPAACGGPIWRSTGHQCAQATLR
jgi:hypothetical protein